MNYNIVFHIFCHLHLPCLSLFSLPHSSPHFHARRPSPAVGRCRARFTRVPVLPYPPTVPFHTTRLPYSTALPYHHHVQGQFTHSICASMTVTLRRKSVHDCQSLCSYRNPSPFRTDRSRRSGLYFRSPLRTSMSLRDCSEAEVSAKCTRYGSRDTGTGKCVLCVFN